MTIAAQSPTGAFLSDGNGHVIPLTPADYERAKAAVMNAASDAGSRITTGQAARILGVSQRTVIRMLDQGRIPYVRYGGTYRYMKLEDVMEYKVRSEHERREALDRMREAMDEINVSDEALAEYASQFK